MPYEGSSRAEYAERVGGGADPVVMALDGIRRSWLLKDRECQQLALLDAIAWGLLAVARRRRPRRFHLAAGRSPQ